MKRIVAVLVLAAVLVSAGHLFAGEKEDMEKFEALFKSVSNPTLTIMQCVMMIRELSDENKNPDTAVATLRKVAEMVPDKPSRTIVRYAIIDILKKSGKREEAINELMKIIEERSKEVREMQKFMEMKRMRDDGHREMGKQGSGNPDRPMKKEEMGPRDQGPKEEKAK
jgi:hypothetical protein